MIEWIADSLKNLIKSIIFPALVLALLFYTWSVYQKDRGTRSFAVSFNKIEGLEKGAPVFAMGALVGKVISTKAMLNEDKIGVKILITKDGFPTPKAGTEARIVPSLQRSGANVVELMNIQVDEEGEGKAIEPLPHDMIMRTTKDLMLTTKDFTMDVIRFMGSPQAKEYQSDLDKQIKGLIHAIEQGDYKGQAKLQLKKLNELAKDSQRNKGRSKVSIEKQLKAIKKSLNSAVSVSDVYKSKEKAEFSNGREY